MNRRNFLTSILGMAAGLTLDPERLLWRPGKLISIPTLRPPSLGEKLLAFDLHKFGYLTSEQLYRIVLPPPRNYYQTPVAHPKGSLVGSGASDRSGRVTPSAPQDSISRPRNPNGKRGGGQPGS